MLPAADSGLLFHWDLKLQLYVEHSQFALCIGQQRPEMDGNREIDVGQEFQGPLIRRFGIDYIASTFRWISCVSSKSAKCERQLHFCPGKVKPCRIGFIDQSSRVHSDVLRVHAKTPEGFGLDAFWVRVGGVLP